MHRAFAWGLAVALLTACTPAVAPLTVATLTTPTAGVIPATETLAPTLEPSPVPATVAATTSDLALGQTVLVTSLDAPEEAADKSFSIETSIPVLTDPTNDPRVTAFNQQVAALVANEVALFKDSLTDLPTPEPNMPGSSLSVQHEALTLGPTLLSVRFSFAYYAQGAAHPGVYFLTVNYDLANGHQLALTDVFLPESSFLERIAEKCKAELTARDIAATLEGADPTLENYRNWNLTPEGLRITFDPYQVAAYAAGPQEITIPWAELQDLLNPVVVNFLPES